MEKNTSQAQSAPPENLWVKLTKDYKTKKAGERIRLANADVRTALIDTGSAEACEDPTGSLAGKAVTDLVAGLGEQIKSLADESVAAAVAEATKAAKTKAIKLPAQPKSDDFDFSGGFKSVGEFAQTVRKASGVEGRADAREKLGKWVAAREKAPSGMFENEDASGGFLVPPQMATAIWDRVRATNDNLLARTNNFTVTGNKFTLPVNSETSRVNGSRWGGTRAYWEGEADQFTQSRPKFGQRELNLKKLEVFTYVTNELLDDASVALEQYINRVAVDELNFKIGDSIVNGTGAGMPQGVLNAACLVSVSKESGQAAATVNYTNIVKMFARLYGPSRANAVWLINQDVEPQLHQMSLAVGTGGSAVYLPPGGASDVPYSRLYGRPVIPVEWCPTLGTVGDILLVDLSQYATITKGGIASAMSIHLRFDYDESVFRWIFRMDGQPLWSSALTPFKGSQTQSPFVALATRS